MKFMDRERLVIEPVERIGNIIPKNRVTLVTGLPGTGKSYSIVKFLNKNSIEPVYFNLDATALGDLKADMFDGKDLRELFAGRNKFEDMKDKVIVVDTYARFEELLFSVIPPEKSKILTNESIVSLLEGFINKYQCTIIIIGHPEDYVGKDSIFKDNPALVRHCYEHLHFEKKITSATVKKINTITEHHILYITKGRAYTGERIIHHWMREDEAEKLMA